MKARLLALLILASQAAAQDPMLAAHLASDHERNGPHALTWIRETILPELSGWPKAHDPFDAISIAITAHGLRVLEPEIELGEGIYLKAGIRFASGGEIQATCDFAGRETWIGSNLGASSDRANELVRLLPIEAGGASVTLDLQALVGNLLAGTDYQNPSHLLATGGAAECGSVTLKIARAGTRLEVIGQSSGGLTLPAALIYLADLQSRPDQSPPLSKLDRWILLATAARDFHREEAARQLSLSTDPRARDTLERLLYAQGDIRMVATDSLIRMGSASSLPLIIATAKPGDTDAGELAMVALRNLLPDATRDERSRTLTSLASHPSDRLRALQDRPSSAVTAGVGSQTELDASTSQGNRDPMPIWPMILAAAIALACLMPHWRRARKSRAAQ